MTKTALSLVTKKNESVKLQPPNQESFRAINQRRERETSFPYSTPTRGKVLSVKLKVSCVRMTAGKSMATKLERAQRGCHAATVVSVLVRGSWRDHGLGEPPRIGAQDLSPSRAHCALALAGAARGLSSFPNSIWRSFWQMSHPHRSCSAAPATTARLSRSCTGALKVSSVVCPRSRVGVRVRV